MTETVRESVVRCFDYWMTCATLFGFSWLSYLKSKLYQRRPVELVYIINQRHSVVDTVFFREQSVKDFSQPSRDLRGGG